MARERRCWSAKESIIRKKKLSELENDMFKQPERSHGHGLTPLRFLNGDKARKKKTVEDLERGWVNSYYKGDVSKQSKSPWYGFRDKVVRTDMTSEEERMQSVEEGWATNFREQKTKQLDHVYGKNSTALSPNKTSTDKRVLENSEEERGGKNYGRSRAVTATELRKASTKKRIGSLHSCCNSGKSTQRSTTGKSNLREGRSLSENLEQDRYLDGVWVRSPKGAEAQPEVSTMGTGRGLRDFEGYSRQGDEKEIMADSGWMSTSRRSTSPRRDVYGQSRERAQTADDIIKEREDKFRETSWFSAFINGQRREMYGLRSYSIGDYLTKKVHKDAEDLSWAANCRAKLKPQMTLAA